MKKHLAFVIAALTALSATSCGKDTSSSDSSDEAGKIAAVRFLNFKPEIATAYEEIVKKYAEETGKTVIVEPLQITPTNRP